MQLHVFERADETLMVVLAPCAEPALPRSCGDLMPLGISQVDEQALHPWVVTRLRSDGVCAVVGDDASFVRLGMDGRPVDPPAPAEARWVQLIG